MQAGAEGSGEAMTHQRSWGGAVRGVAPGTLTQIPVPVDAAEPQGLKDPVPKQ